MREIKESEWKRLRKLETVALERFCTRILREAGDVCVQRSKTAHERYLQLYRLLLDRDAEMARAFNDLRRSTALARLLNMTALGLLANDELSGFSEETQDLIRAMPAARG